MLELRRAVGALRQRRGAGPGRRGAAGRGDHLRARRERLGQVDPRRRPLRPAPARRGRAARGRRRRCASARRARPGPPGSRPSGRTSPSRRCCRSGGTSSSAPSPCGGVAAAPVELDRAREVTVEAMARVGVTGLDPDQPASALQAGERHEPGGRPGAALRRPGAGGRRADRGDDGHPAHARAAVGGGGPAPRARGAVRDQQPALRPPGRRPLTCCWPAAPWPAR